MAKARLCHASRESRLLTGVLGLVLLWSGGCAAEHQKASGTAVSPEQVRSHADKAFDKLKQEEQQQQTVAPATGH